MNEPVFATHWDRANELMRLEEKRRDMCALITYAYQSGNGDLEVEARRRLADIELLMKEWK